MGNSDSNIFCLFIHVPKLFQTSFEMFSVEVFQNTLTFGVYFKGNERIYFLGMVLRVVFLENIITQSIPG